MRIGTSRLRHHRARRWSAIALLVAAISMAAGCALLGTGRSSPPEPAVPEAEASSPPPSAGTDPGRLVLDQWRQGWLHCAAQKCQNSYTVEVTSRGKLRIDARAPGGQGLPDFGVVVEDLQERLVGASIHPQERPRVVRKDVEPGTYRVQVYALGSNGEMLSYDLVAKLEKKTKPKPRRKARKPKPPEFRVLKSEILEVEREGGEPTFVLIEAGQRQALTPGLTGQLVENGNRIAGIKVVEVFPDGSRVRIVDRLAAPITIETTAEIHVPK
jgi:hypothetical protein